MSTFQDCIRINPFQVLDGIHVTAHWLGDGYDLCTYNAIWIRLNNVIWKFEEDPDDGYRSYMLGPIPVFEEMKMENEFSGVYVRCLYKNTNLFSGLWLFNPKTNALILEAGTKNTDDYYPVASWRWYPENLPHNDKMTRRKGND